LNPRSCSSPILWLNLKDIQKMDTYTYYLLQAIHSYSRKGVHDIFGSWYVLFTICFLCETFFICTIM
jgi:hypothetical protein